MKGTRPFSGKILSEKSATTAIAQHVTESIDKGQLLKQCIKIKIAKFPFIFRACWNGGNELG